MDDIEQNLEYIENKNIVLNYLKTGELDEEYRNQAVELFNSEEDSFEKMVYAYQKETNKKNSHIKRLKGIIKDLNKIYVTSLLVSWVFFSLYVMLNQ